MTNNQVDKERKQKNTVNVKAPLLRQQQHEAVHIKGRDFSARNKMPAVWRDSYRELQKIKISCVTQLKPVSFQNLTASFCHFQLMEITNGSDPCSPQRLNRTSRIPIPPSSDAIIVYILLSFISVLTAALNLLVILSISYFRYTA